MGNTRGAVLLVAIVTGMIIAISAYGIITLVGGGLRRAKAFQERVPARYAVEAGLVYALQQLEEDPRWSAPSPGGHDETIDGIPIKIFMEACTTDPCEDRPIQVTATYE